MTVLINYSPSILHSVSKVSKIKGRRQQGEKQEVKALPFLQAFRKICVSVFWVF